MATQPFPRKSLRAITSWRIKGRDKNTSQEASDQDVHPELKKEQDVCDPELRSLKLHIKCVRKVVVHL
jgi:hypothetical protein